MQKLLVLIFNILLQSEILVIEEFKIDIDPITPVYWINNNEILVNEYEESYVYNIIDRESKELFIKGVNEIYGYDNGEIYICKTETKDRNTIDDYSTHLSKTDLDGNLLLDIELKPTLEVLECRDNVILKTVFPIEEKFYVFSNDLYELKEYEEAEFSPNLRNFLYIDALGNYRIKNLRFSKSIIDLFHDI